MRRSNGRLIQRQAGAILCGVLLLCPASLMAQTAEPASLSSDQLDDLVAPIALYPDPLLGQVLAASTYPLEVVEAQQWLQQNRALQGARLLDAARQQNWDPSVQALVAFPNVLTLLNRDIRWTTDLGNAFLAQQADVMNAVQRMRSRARANGRLDSTPEQSVTVQTQDGQSAIEIQPANPQIIYVPTYNPAYVWGPPVLGSYPALGYPGTGFGFGFNPGVLIGAIFSGLLSFGGWGWGLNWLAHALFLNNLFLGHFGFGGFGGGLGGRTAWAHNQSHRLGVPYPNRVVASRFSTGGSHAGLSNVRPNNARNAGSYNARPYSASSARSLSTRAQTSVSAHAGTRSYQSYSGGVEGSRYNSPAQRYRSSSSSARAPAARYSAPRMGSRSSQPRASTRSSRSRAPHLSTHSGHSSGGHSSKHK